MNGYNYILEKQLNWAKRNKLELVGSQIDKGKKTYTSTLEKNLFEPLLNKTLTEINQGDGGELKKDNNHAAKMCALHSSSALGVNVFQYWTNKNISTLAYSLGLCRKDNNSSQEILFEQKYQISENFKFSPNIDVIIKNDNSNINKVYGIECKFSEAYSARNHQGLKEKYITDISEQWHDIPNIFDLAKAISPIDSNFKHLHPAQLIKHILGLKKVYGKKGFRLLYLWYDAIGQESYIHKQEIDEFSNIAKLDNIKFHSISYQELIIKLSNEFYEKNEKYIDYLTDRYL